MTIGQLNHLMTVQEAVLAPDGGGGFTVTWAEVAQVYAGIAELTETESPQFRQLEPRAVCRITILHRDGLRPDMRLSDGARTYEIISMRDPDGRKAYLEIIARKR